MFTVSESGSLLHKCAKDYGSTNLRETYWHKTNPSLSELPDCRTFPQELSLSLYAPRRRAILLYCLVALCPAFLQFGDYLLLLPIYFIT